MFSFANKQKEMNIGDFTIGGQPGRFPTVLIGGLFFSGKPDFSHAKKEIETMYEMSKKTGLPAICDFFIKKDAYLDDIISFIDETHPKNQPFSVDVTDPMVKVKVLKRLDEVGLLCNAIYNSIHIGISDEEFSALQEYHPLAAILVAFNPKDTSPDGKIEVLETGAHVIQQGLFSIAKACNINRLLVDTAALAPGQNSGASVAAIPVIKEEYGLPTGCAIHNVVEKSSWLKSFSDSKVVVDVASNINISLFGGDFAIFGAMKHASKVFPIMAWQDIMISEYVEQYFGVKPSDTHPRRIFYG